MFNLSQVQKRMEVALTSFIALPMHMQLVKGSVERFMMKIVGRKNMSAGTRLKDQGLDGNLDSKRDERRSWTIWAMIRRWMRGFKKKLTSCRSNHSLSPAQVVCNLMMQLHLPYYLVIIYYEHCFNLQNANTFNSWIHVLQLIVSTYELIFHTLILISAV